jgi:hypothetical protein
MSKGGGGSIPNPWTLKVGSDGTTIHSDADVEIQPVTVNSNIAVTQPIVTQSKSDSNSNIAVTQPIVTQSTSKSDANANLDLKVEPLDIKIEPLKVSSDSTSEIDVKPLAIDSCQTLKLAPLPPLRMEQPYAQHFGITFLGIELWGINISGKSEMFLHSPPRQRHFRVETAKPCAGGEPAQDEKPAPAHRPSGLRVRVK